MGHDPWPGTQTDGCSRRRTAAVGGLVMHTPRGAATGHHWQDKVRLREPPIYLSVPACGRLGERRRNRGSLNRDTTRHTPKLAVDKLSVKPQPRGQDADARSRCQSITASSDCWSPSPVRWKLLASCSDYSIGQRESVCLSVCLSACLSPTPRRVYLLPSIKPNRHEFALAHGFWPRLTFPG